MGRAALRGFLPLIALAALPGCLATRQEIEDLRADILRLQESLGRVQAMQGESKTELQGNQADLMSQMATLSRHIEVLSANLDESQNRMGLMSTRMDDLDKNLSNRLDLLSELMSGSKLTADPSPSTLFNLAYGDFNRRRYEQSLRGFQTYLDKYPDTEKAADAQFYTGEAHLALGAYDKAVDAFDKVFVKHSTSTVVPTAYLQKGAALEKMNKPSEALAVYEAVIKKYPHRRESAAAHGRVEVIRNAGLPVEPR
jgi:tol-pal system protein YbgF